MGKPKRIDLKKISWVGAELKRYYGFTATGCTEYEDHSGCDFWFEIDGKRHSVELKTVCGCFNGGKKYLPSNPKWDWETFDGDVAPTGRTWMLNYLECDGVTPGKFQRLEPDECLVYLFMDGWLIFNPKALKEAFLGTAVYTCSRRQEFEKKYLLECIPQRKAVINLEAGSFVPCTPPDDFFVHKNNETFNRDNRG